MEMKPRLHAEVLAEKLRIERALKKEQAKQLNRRRYGRQFTNRGVKR